MERNNTRSNIGEELPSGSESRSAASFVFSPKWGFRKRPMFAKHHADNNCLTNSSGAQPAASGVDRRKSNNAGETNGGGNRPEGILLGSEKRIKIEPGEGIRVKKEESSCTHGAGSCSSSHGDVAEVRKMLTNFGEMWKSMDGKIDGLATRLDIVERKIMSDLASLREEMKASHKELLSIRGRE